MSRESLYPWAALERVGDYFVVDEEASGKSARFMKQTVWIRNKLCAEKGLGLRYAVAQTSYGCVVFLAQTHESLPEGGVETSPGIHTYATDISQVPSPRSTTLGTRPKPQKMSQSERVARMSAAQREANLPWWWDSGRLIWNMNPRIKKRPEDLDAFMEKRFSFRPDDPYPDEYWLDEDLMRKSDEQILEEQELAEQAAEDEYFEVLQESGGE